MSGTWILGRPPSSQPGLFFYIMVDNVTATLDAVVVPGARSSNRLVLTHLK